MKSDYAAYKSLGRAHIDNDVAIYAETSTSLRNRHENPRPLFEDGIKVARNARATANK